MDISWGKLIYCAALAWAYLGQPAIFVAGLLYTYAKRTTASFIILAGLLIRVVGGIADWRICDKAVVAGQPIETVYSNWAHLASTFAWHLGHVLIGVGVLIVAIQEVISKKRNKPA